MPPQPTHMEARLTASATAAWATAWAVCDEGSERVIKKKPSLPRRVRVSRLGTVFRLVCCACVCPGLGTRSWEAGLATFELHKDELRGPGNNNNNLRDPPSM